MMAGEEQDYTRFTLKDMIVLVVLPKLDELRDQAAETNAKMDSKASIVEVEKLEERVDTLEAWRNRMLGAIAVSWAAITAALVIIARHFGA